MIQISKAKDLILSILNDNQSTSKHPNQKFCKTWLIVLLSGSAPLGKSEDYGAVLLKH
jgi:hypothetical protein